MVMQPAGIPGYERRNFGQAPDEEGFSVGACVIWAVPGLQVQLRVHDYSMGELITLVYRANLFRLIFQKCPLTWTQ